MVAKPIPRSRPTITHASERLIGSAERATARTSTGECVSRKTYRKSERRSASRANTSKHKLSSGIACPSRQ